MELRDYVSQERLKACVEALNKFHRLSGTEPDHKAVDYVVSQLESAGVPYKLHEFDAYVSLPGPASLNVVEPRYQNIPCITHSFGAPTPEGGITAELVFVGDGEEVDYEGINVKGKVVMFGGYKGLVMPAKVKRAEDHGACAVISVNFDEVLHEMIVSTVWGTPTLDTAKELPKVPALSISWSSGESLKRLLENGKVTVHIEASVDTRWRKLRLPIAEIVPEGSKEDCDFFLLGGHMDSWYEGITDNATGDAVLLELALAFHKIRNSLKRGVRVAWWPGHSHGRYAGSAWYADNAWLEIDQHCVGVLIVDSPGVKGATVQRLRSAEESRELAVNVIKEMGYNHISLLRPERVGDQSFLGIGVTSMSLNSELAPDHPDRRPVGGSGGGWWWHSKWDSIDKYDPKVAYNDALVIGEVVRRVVSSDVLPYKLAGTAGHFLEVLKERAKQCQGVVDLSCAVKLGEEVLEIARKFDELAQSGKIPSQQANKVILKVTRDLNPVLYTKSGRFYQDPAVNEELLPGLAAAALVKSKHVDIAGFAKFQVIKERNRVVDALLAAKEHISVGLAV